jgi:ribose-phosphate pyrophosphokinase
MKKELAQMKVIAYLKKESQPVTLNYDCFTFSGGEEHVRFLNKPDQAVTLIQITVRLTSSSELMKLIIAVDALKRLFGSKVSMELICPYFPYARQDRVCVEGEALGAAVMAKLLNTLAFDKVTIWDAHSEVTPALINNVVNTAQEAIIERCQPLVELLKSKTVTLISPDAGATKKTQNVAKYFGGGIEVLQAEKVRDLSTGAITHTDLHGDVTGKDVLIVDDICDGGRTFLELAKVLKIKGSKSISLFVTHGIFSKGLAVFDGIIDNIYTTDSFIDFSQDEQSSTNTKLTIVSIEG